MTPRRGEEQRERPPTVPDRLAAALADADREAARLADPAAAWLNDPARGGGCDCHRCTGPPPPPPRHVTAKGITPPFNDTARTCT